MSHKLRLSAACAGGMPLLRLRGVQRLHLDVERVLLLLAQMPGGVVALAVADLPKFYTGSTRAGDRKETRTLGSCPGSHCGSHS